MVLSTDTATANSELTIQCMIKNTGKYKGDEVAQLYVSDEVSSVVTYEKVLRGFKRISLEPGEEQLVVFNLNTKDLSLLNIDMIRVTERGSFRIEIGSSSKDIRLEEKLNVK